jgi:hypothetical protein
MQKRQSLVARGLFATENQKCLRIPGYWCRPWQSDIHVTHPTTVATRLSESLGQQYGRQASCTPTQYFPVILRLFRREFF